MTQHHNTAQLKLQSEPDEQRLAETARAIAEQYLAEAHGDPARALKTAVIDILSAATEHERRSYSDASFGYTRGRRCDPLVALPTPKTNLPQTG
jgi:hypothetical protein